MDKSLDSLSRKTFTGTGALTAMHGSVPLACTIRLSQLFNGRISFEIDIDEKQHRINPGRLGEFDFSGSLVDGRQLTVKGLIVENDVLHMHNFSHTWLGFLNYPGYFEIYSLANSLDFVRVTFEVTNLPLYGVGPIEIDINGDKIKLQEVSDYKSVRHLISALKTGGILSNIDIVFSHPKIEEEVDKYMREVCGLLTLSQRSHVWHTEYHLENASGVTVKSHYEEPVFIYSRPSRPLVPVDSLESFFRISFVNFEAKIREWNLGEAQDFYIQAMALTSAWSISLGFFTTLETFKNAFLHQQGYENLEFYVLPKTFKTLRIFEKVFEALCAGYDEFKALADDKKDTIQQKDDKKTERETIRSKIADINRRAYKSILRSMFQQLGMTVDNKDLKNLVDLRNQIIHSGSPNYQKGPWKTSNDAFQWACRFGGIVEKTFLAILQYKGKFEPYDQSVIPR